jgi:hypothetical protein
MFDSHPDQFPSSNQQCQVEDTFSNASWQYAVAFVVIACSFYALILQRQKLQVVGGGELGKKITRHNNLIEQMAKRADDYIRDIEDYAYIASESDAPMVYSPSRYLSHEIPPKDIKILNDMILCGNTHPTNKLIKVKAKIIAAYVKLMSGEFKESQQCYFDAIRLRDAPDTNYILDLLVGGHHGIFAHNHSLEEKSTLLGEQLSKINYYICCFTTIEHRMSQSSPDNIADI